jgi:hypothetical protein
MQSIGEAARLTRPPSAVDCGGSLSRALRRARPSRGHAGGRGCKALVKSAARRKTPRWDPPVYGVGERSGIKIWNGIPRISWLLVKRFFWRMREKYVIRDFHPLVFFYAFGFLMTLLGLGLGIVEVVLRLMGNAVSVGTVVLVALLLIFGSQFTLFAMWFDMESNKDLR